MGSRCKGRASSDPEPSSPLPEPSLSPSSCPVHTRAAGSRRDEEVHIAAGVSAGTRLAALVHLRTRLSVLRRVATVLLLHSLDTWGAAGSRCDTTTRPAAAAAALVSAARILRSDVAVMSPLGGRLDMDGAGRGAARCGCAAVRKIPRAPRVHHPPCQGWEACCARFARPPSTFVLGETTPAGQAARGGDMVASLIPPWALTTIFSPPSPRKSPPPTPGP